MKCECVDEGFVFIYTVLGFVGDGWTNGGERQQVLVGSE
jgi:hypothetical protein